MHGVDDGSVDGMDHGSGMDGDDGSGVDDGRGVDDRSVHGVDDGAAVVDDLAALSDGRLGADDGDGVDRVDDWGLVGEEDARSGGGASQESGEGDLEEIIIVKDHI